MGLDIYVGSLTRYYTGDWKTVVQQWGEQHGYPVVTVRPEDLTLGGRLRRFTGRLFGQRGPTPAQVRGTVTAWRAALNRELGQDLREPLDWDEAEETPYFTDKPAWDGYWGVVLLAAYAEHPELVRPEKLSLEDLEKDPALSASTAEGFRSRFRQLVDPGVELWLPSRFEFTFRAQSLPGTEVGIGSSVVLLEQLRELGSAALQASDEELEAWSREGADEEARFDRMARFGLAIMLELAEKSVTHRLPMKLDY